MGILLVILAIAMAVATFIENDFGASVARSAVYNEKWFELIFLLLVINLTGQIITFRLYRREKLTVMLFHAAFIIMIAGAAITRYTGYDGMMHIREGSSSQTTYSSENELVFGLSDENGSVINSLSRAVPDAGALKRFNRSLRTEKGKVSLRLNGYISNAVREVEESEGGVPMVALMATPDMTTSENIVLAAGESGMIGELSIGFDNESVVQLVLDNGNFSIRSSMPMRVTNMENMSAFDCPADSLTALKPRMVYSVGGYKIVPRKLTLSGVATLAASSTAKGHGENNNAFDFTLTSGADEKRIYLWDDPRKNSSEWNGEIDGMKVRVSYGSTASTLPFTLTLNDFVIDRYPGSNSPSGFKSLVTLTDESQAKEFDFAIYMNHILKYRGYRFYQSSYDPDETGTILSVNHDPAGMYTTYAGYALLFLFIILSIINPRSFFRTVGKSFWNSRYRAHIVMLIVMTALSSFSPAMSQQLVLDRQEADRFGEVLAQDQKGRTKPLYTISNDILRKVARENSFEGMSSMQVLLGYSLDFYHWQTVPLIKISNAELRNTLNIKGEYAAFSDLVTFGSNGGYLLSSYIEKAYSKPESGRTKFDKEVIKVDERVNICYMMSRGDFLRLFPMRDSTDHWGNADDAVKNLSDRGDSLFVVSVIPLWAQTVSAVGKPDVGSDEYIQAIKNYQRKYAGYNLPSTTRVNAELFYYKSRIFEKLFPFYATLGLIMIITLIGFIISGRELKGVFVSVLTGLAIAGFIFHTAGLAIRWYISGHSPMSNGYESMIFISWVTMLAGFLFSRKSKLTLAATLVLAGMTLMVAHLSFMDPEITNLVPVLKSYWLTLHVSVITGSYSFLGLGALLGIIVMVMMLLVNRNNVARISATIDELTVINYKTITLGLYFLTIGTFLGAVWANESWGRYWGWDPKETWSLITILVYTVVTHSRLIPGMKDVYTFNLLSLAAFSSVLMTYFGVNYYLSGLHSYAAGDPVPIPAFVYIAITILIVLAVASWYRYRNTRHHL